jgi:hypothetical protein
MRTAGARPARELAHGVDEAGARPGDEDACGRGGADVDVADVDRAAHEGDEIGQSLEHRARPRGRAVGDDDLAAAGELDQLLAGERGAGLVEAHLADLPEPGQRLVAVVVGARVARVGQENPRHAAFPRSAPRLPAT